MHLDNKIKDFLNSLEGEGQNLFPYLANKSWSKGKPIYYSGPYWENEEIISAISSLINGKWLSAGENVNKFFEFIKKDLEEIAERRINLNSYKINSNIQLTHENTRDNTFYELGGKLKCCF